MPDTWSTAYTVNVTFGPEMFEMTDITAHIVKPDGTVSEEPVLQQIYTLNMTGNSVPDKAGVLFTFVPKTNVDPDKIYHVSIRRNIKVTSYKNGEIYSDYSTSTVETKLPLKGNQVTDYFTEKGVAVTAGVTADGDAIYINPDQFDFGLNGVWEWLAGILSGK